MSGRTSTITVPVLAAAVPADYAEAADNLERIADAFSQVKSQFEGRVLGPVGQAWKGGAADSAAASLSGLLDQLSATHENLTRFIGLLRSGAEGIADAQAYLRAAQTVAQHNGCEIGDDGTVLSAPTGAWDAASGTGSGTASGTGSGFGPESAAAGQGPAGLRAGTLQAQEMLDVRGEIQDLVERAVSTAEAVNDPIAEALEDRELFGIGAHWVADAATGLASAQALETRLAQAEIPGPDTSPTEVQLWWATLPVAQQQQYIRDQSALVGALNGLPAPVRDKANRRVLAEDIAAYQAKIRSLTSSQARIEAEMAAMRTQHIAYAGSGGKTTVMNTAYMALGSRLEALNAELAAADQGLGGMQTIESELATAGKPQQFFGAGKTTPPMYLLGFDDKGIGHAEIACGDPDTAQNVCVYVPGLNTSALDPHFVYDIQHTQNMTLMADQDAGQGSTSTILWLGYNAPQFSLGAPSPQVLSPDDATAAVAGLTSYVNSLRVTNHAITNLTLLGHSYGSLVVGETAKQSALPVDNIVLVGSPGVSVDNASQLNISPDHVWTGRAPADPVAGSGWFGIPPTDVTFGATQFTVDATGGGPLMYEHGDYFDAPGNANHDQGTESLRNIGHIITGQYGQVSTVPEATRLSSPDASFLP